MAEKLATRPAMAASPALPLGARNVVVKETKFSWDDPAQRNPVILLVVFTLLLIYAYWVRLVETSVAWQQDLYSHGYVVPFMALGIMWVRRKPFEPVPALERWIGVGILVVSQAARVILAAQYDVAPIDRLSFIGSLFGLFLMVGGWHLIKWAGPAIVFLIFMFPLPSRLEQPILGGLQRVAAAVSTIVLQTLGVSAFRVGNTISIAGVKDAMEVAEACSGMRMLTIFLAMSVAMVFFIDRPWWDKLVLLLSAVPIALASNVIRITLTGLLFKLSDDETLHQWIHDLAGYFMMFIGLGLLWLEMQILNRLSVPEEEGVLAPMGGLGGPGRGTVPLR